MYIAILSRPSLVSIAYKLGLSVEAAFELAKTKLEVASAVLCDVELWS